MLSKHANADDTFFQICTISHHLLNSAIIHDCSDDLTNLQDLDDSKKRKILDRCGQFEDECGDGSNICKTHLEALDSKFKQNANCVAENHDKDKSRRIRGKDLNNAETVSPALSKHVKVSKFQKQIFMYSFEPKTEQFFIDLCPKDLKWVE